MVSLLPSNTQSGGIMSFEERSPITTTDTPLCDNTPLIIGIEQSYRQIRTTCIIIAHIVLVILFETVIVLFPFLCYDKRVSRICDQHSPYNISLYIHASAYIGSIIFDRLYYYHHDLSRREGYLQFHRRTRNLRRAPLVVISTGNAILVAMIKLLEDYQSLILPVQPWHCLAILTTLEVIIILCVLFRYLVLTVKFNRDHAPPDATLDDLLSSFATLQPTANEIGFRDESYMNNVLERQADLIRHLHERNENLSRLTNQLQQQLNGQQS